MDKPSLVLTLALAGAACLAYGVSAFAGSAGDRADRADRVQVGARPASLVQDMDHSPLKRRLERCAGGTMGFKRTDFSIGHRGAPLGFPEHTRESYQAAARMGAGVLECDVTFTRDKALVCRHAQCDLHTTTDILATPLAAKCSRPFQPAVLDAEGNVKEAASARCCTSDITLAEFKTLEGRMDTFNPAATSVEAYLDGTADRHTDLYASRGTLMTHAESIQLFQALGTKMTPELKSPGVAMPYDSDGDGVADYTQEDYAQQMIDEYKAAGVPPDHVWAQSFSLRDVRYWLRAEPAFGRQAVYLDGRYGDPDFDFRHPGTWEPSMEELADQGVNIIAPPLWMLVTLDGEDRVVPSAYAREARAAGLAIVTWTLERSGPLTNGGGWYYQSVSDAIDNDGDMLDVLHVLARDVGIQGIFSDWPGTVTFYANCMGLP